GAALGAGLVAVAGRRLLSPLIRRRWGGRLVPLEAAAREDGFSYLLAIRLLPVVPAWLANLLPVAVPIPLRWVLLATFLGLLPISIIVAGVGNGVASVSTDSEALSAALLLQREVLLPL